MVDRRVRRVGMQARWIRVDGGEKESRRQEWS